MKQKIETLVGAYESLVTCYKVLANLDNEKDRELICEFEENCLAYFEYDIKKLRQDILRSIVDGY